MFETSYHGATGTVREDDRTPDQKVTHRWAVVGRDRFLSGWGGARGGYSRAAWAVPSDDSVNLNRVEKWVRARGDMVTRFEYSDYRRDPAKYALFRTAIVARHIFTNNGERDLPEGAIVGIAYRGPAWNHLFRREEPVYTVTHNGVEWGDVYGNCLTGYVL